MPKPSWTGAAQGAMQGASAGSAAGPWGALAGGVAGGALGLFTGGSKGKKEKLKKVPTGTPEQERLGAQIVDQARNMMGKGGSYSLAQDYYNQYLNPNTQEAYGNFASPYLQQFEEQVLPMIAERFAGMGGLSSSGFGQSLGGAGAGLQSQLAQLFSKLQSDAAAQNFSQFNQLSTTGLNYQPFAYYQKPGGAGQTGGFLQGFDMGSLGNLGSMFQGVGGGGGGGMPNAANQMSASSHSLGGAFGNFNMGLK